MVSIEHKIRWTFHIGSYHRIMKDISWRLHRTKMKLRAYYITLHLQHKILYTFLFLLHSTFAANVWWCIHRRSLILELLLFLLCADLRNLLQSLFLHHNNTVLYKLEYRRRWNDDVGVTTFSDQNYLHQCVIMCVTLAYFSLLLR